MNTIEILLVEDNEGDIFLTAEALKESTFSNTLHVVRDGVEALDFLHKKGKYSTNKIPDLILLDINLPKVNGFEVLKQIKDHEALKHLPVILLSTSSAKEDVLKGYAGYASCYIAKPVDADDFSKTISLIQNFYNNVVQLPKLV